MVTEIFYAEIPADISFEEAFEDEEEEGDFDAEMLKKVKSVSDTAPRVGLDYGEDGS